MKMNLQRFAGKATNVFPVLDNKFKVGAAKESATVIADMETFSVSFTNGVQTWTPMDTEGWQRALLTAKSRSLSAVKETSETLEMIMLQAKRSRTDMTQKATLNGRCRMARAFPGQMLYLISRIAAAVAPQM